MTEFSDMDLRTLPDLTVYDFIDEVNEVSKIRFMVKQNKEHFSHEQSDGLQDKENLENSQKPCSSNVSETKPVTNDSTDDILLDVLHLPLHVGD